MSRRPISDELRPYVDRGDADGVNDTAERLTALRPVPKASFRAELKAHLIEMEQGGVFGRRPRNLRAAIAAYAASGLALLGLAALGVGGIGPLSP